MTTTITRQWRGFRCDIEVKNLSQSATREEVRVFFQEYLCTRTTDEDGKVIEDKAEPLVGTLKEVRICLPDYPELQAKIEGVVPDVMAIANTKLAEMLNPPEPVDDDTLGGV